MNLTGKRIVVVGATGGLGSEIAQLLHAAGANLVLVGRDAAKLQQLGITAEMFTIDLLGPGSAAALIDRITADAPIDGLIIAHGTVAFGQTADLDDSTISTIVTLNQTTPMQLIRAAIPALRKSNEQGNQPFIATITGVVAETPTIGLAAYSSAKAGLLAFVNVLRREVRRDGIRVIDARPPHTETELSKHPVQGVAPQFATGLEPQFVVARIVQAIRDGETDLPSTAFAAQQ